jgi:DNA repair exonuclease SbcCD nuclease subunit
MKIIHFSDTHLGIWIDNTLRSEDFYKNFWIVINKILKEKPDYVIHSWDLFNSSKPSNKAISVAVSWFLKLEKAWIKTILIAWNHDSPRLTTTTHPFSIFENFENLKIAYKEEIHLFEEEKINFVCLPHIYSQENFDKNFSKALDKINKDKINIFVSHFWLQVKEYEEYTNEISWVNILLENLEKLKKFDYVALWHYHKNFCIWKQICYSWSIEHTSFNAKNHNIWYNILEFNKQKKLEKKYIKLESRKMLDLWFIDCTNIKNTIELKEKIISKFSWEKEFEEEISQAIVKIFFENINNNLLLEFQDKIIIDLFKNAFYFEYKKSKLQDKNFNFDLNIDTKKDNFVKDSFWVFLDKINFPEYINKTELEKELIELL